jgi:hypothetical protein
LSSLTIRHSCRPLATGDDVAIFQFIRLLFFSFPAPSSPAAADRGPAADNPEEAVEQRTDEHSWQRWARVGGRRRAHLIAQTNIEHRESWGAWALRGSNHAGNGTKKRVKDVCGMTEKETQAREKRGKSTGVSGECFVAPREGVPHAAPTRPQPLCKVRLLHLETVIMCSSRWAAV